MLTLSKYYTCDSKDKIGDGFHDKECPVLNIPSNIDPSNNNTTKQVECEENKRKIKIEQIRGNIVGSILKNKYLLCEEVGKGQFGNIYDCVNMYN